MSYTSKFYLTGGIFFFLITTFAKKNVTHREYSEGKKDKNSNANILNDFLNCFDIRENPCSRKDVSQYINCRVNGSLGVPLNDKLQIDGFIKKIKNEYDNVIKDMTLFISKHINPRMKENLVSALICIIENDDDIPEEQEFFIKSDGSSITKANIRNKSDFCLESFLVGVFRYIEENRSMENDKGKDTLDLISEKKFNNGPRIYDIEKINSQMREVNVSSLESISEKSKSKNPPCSNNDTASRENKNTVSDLDDVPDDYTKRAVGFLNAINNLINNARISEMEIYYKSSDLGEKYLDINEYISKKKWDIVDLNSEKVTEFKNGVIYKYTGICAFKSDNNKIISSIIYNDKKISGFTSERNWINQSMLDLYVNDDESRCCTCYFMVVQKKKFKFLQIGDVED